MMLLLLYINFFASIQGSAGAAKKPRSLPSVPFVPSINQLAKRGGYKATNYELFTEDGYSIWLHRIGENSGSPVLIQHGIMLAADSWITRGHNKKDLAFMLLDLGYDVWLSNHRGTFFNEYSIKYNRTDPRFWDFSFHESGIYDLPVAVDKILEVRKLKKIFYVGHSLGTITFAVMCTMKPEYNNKIEAAMLLSPVIYPRPYNRLNPFLRTLGSFSDAIVENARKTGNYDLGLRNTHTEVALKVLCGEQAITQSICLGIVAVFAGENCKNINPKDWSNFLPHVSGTSLKTVLHVYQLVLADDFVQFDYHPWLFDNLKKYNSTKPPRYNLKLLTTPVGLFWSYNDGFMDEKSVKKTADALPHLLVNFPVEDKSFSHLDMVIGDNANIVLYPHIIKQIESINKKKMRRKT
ncbi:unnamed protein product [Nezara viridula]|uniref:Lipase n=1 Tax=Nezara viridula TaxID=85310 RepID=A0A9P0MMW4_NEZVI|nr:unnamed protein product [Nezara viridula]